MPGVQFCRAQRHVVVVAQTRFPAKANSPDAIMKQGEKAVQVGAERKRFSGTPNVAGVGVGRGMHWFSIGFN